MIIIDISLRQITSKEEEKGSMACREQKRSRRRKKRDNS